MNVISYSLIVLVPTLVLVIIIPLLGSILYLKVTNFGRLVATYTFPNILQKRKNANGTVSWRVRDVEIEEGSDLTKITRSFCLLFLTLILTISSMFFQLLLLEVSYDCDPDEKNKDCFEFKGWDVGSFSKTPINCSSTVVINGSVKVICYEIVFNLGTAAGASYGVFKISNGVLELLATLILKPKSITVVCIVKTVIVLLSFGVFAAIMVVQATPWRTYIETTNFSYIYQALGTLIMALQFALVVPWKDIIRKVNKKRSTGEQELGLDNIVVE